MSHNVYSVEKNFTLKELPNYLIYNGNQIFIASCITKAIEIAKTENRICSIFEIHGSNGKYYHHLIDCSKGVL